MHTEELPQKDTSVRVRNVRTPCFRQNTRPSLRKLGGQIAERKTWPPDGAVGKSEHNILNVNCPSLAPVTIIIIFFFILFFYSLFSHLSWIVYVFKFYPTPTVISSYLQTLHLTIHQTPNTKSYTELHSKLLLYIYFNQLTIYKHFA